MFDVTIKNKKILRVCLIVTLMSASTNTSFSQIDIASDPSSFIDQKGANDKIPLRILYAGMPDTERQKDFVTFLSLHFKEVRTTDVVSFKEEQAQGSDVVILDKDGIQWGSRGGNPLYDLKISDKYSRATVSLGIPGAFLYDRMDLKPGYR